MIKPETLIHQIRAGDIEEHVQDFIAGICSPSSASAAWETINEWPKGTAYVSAQQI
jgi:hypothetical protein